MVKTYNNVISEEKCKELINEFPSAAITHLEHEARVCDGFVVAGGAGHAAVFNELPSIIEEYARMYEKEMGIDPKEMEHVQITKYKKNEGYFSQHSDGMGRTYSVILYLNEVENGGETRFYGEFPYIVKPQPGKLIFFSSDLMHEATVPESGDKYIAVTWFK
jgi:hypothetical protein